MSDVQKLAIVVSGVSFVLGAVIFRSIALFGQLTSRIKKLEADLHDVSRTAKTAAGWIDAIDLEISILKASRRIQRRQLRELAMLVKPLRRNTRAFSEAIKLISGLLPEASMQSRGVKVEENVEIVAFDGDWPSVGPIEPESRLKPLSEFSSLLRRPAPAETEGPAEITSAQGTQEVPASSVLIGDDVARLQRELREMEGFNNWPGEYNTGSEVFAVDKDFGGSIELDPLPTERDIFEEGALPDEPLGGC